MIPVPIVRWVFVGLAFGLSGYFLIRNVYPVLATVRHLFFTPRVQLAYLRYLQAETKATRLLIIIIVLLHAALALTYKIMFFSYYVVKLGPDVSIPGTEPVSSSTSAMPHTTSS